MSGRLGLPVFLGSVSVLVWAALLQASTSPLLSAVGALNATIGVWAHWVRWQHGETTPDPMIEAPHAADQYAVATRTVAAFLVFGWLVTETL